MAYTRENPSPEYIRAVELGREYQIARKTWTGRHSFQSYPLLRELIAKYGTRDVLDWGSGKGEQYSYRDIRLLNTKDDEEKTVYPTWQEALGVESIYPFDPCIPQYSTLPSHSYDGVFSVDVLPYVPTVDLRDWVVETMFSFSNQWVYNAIPCFDGKKVLADGSLGHKTIQSFDWWVELFYVVGKRFPKIHWELRLEAAQPPISHRRFRGQGDVVEEAPRWWRIYKPEQLKTLTKKQQEELEMIAHKEQEKIDLRALIARCAILLFVFCMFGCKMSSPRTHPTVVNTHVREDIHPTNVQSHISHWDR